MQRNNRGFASTSQSNHLTASLSAPARPESLLAPVFRHKTCRKTKDDEWNWNLSCRHYANGISTLPYDPCAYKYMCLFTWLDLNSTVQYILRYLTSRFSQLYEDPVPEILFNAMLVVERQDKDDWRNILEVMTCRFLNFDGGLVAAL